MRGLDSQQYDPRGGQQDSNKPRFEIAAQLAAVEHELTLLGHVVDTLCDRIMPTLRNDPGQPVASATRPSPLTPMGERISDYVDRLQAINARLVSTVDRLEL